ncbi:ABC transporter ATP-binding protein [Konateibacter massiliensis]|uniref:ABC transporter ATP-binding protein n=1 Tax=Konateibacter massiliensis TaxID=2002841 RepID=UPI001F20FAB7|nr:ABC transporter ATP-binding protein [Konateibacter massiliensis]
MNSKRKHTLKRLLQYLLKSKGLLTLAILLGIGGNILALFSPMLSGYAINYIEPGKGAVDFSKVLYYVIMMVITFTASSLLSYLLTLIMLQIGKEVSYQLRKDVFDSLMGVPVSYFDVHPTGDIISKISYDIDTVNTSLSSDLVTICSSVIMVVGSFLMMIVISPSLVVIFLFTVPLSILVTRKLTGVTRPLFRKRSARMGELNGFAEEMTTGLKTLKAYNQEKNTTDKFAEKNKAAVDAYYEADYQSSIVGPLVNGINNLSMTLVSVIGAIFYLLGSMNLGSISSFILYSRKFSGPINEAANIISEFQSSLAAAERVFQIIDEAPEPEDRSDAKPIDGIEGRVELRNVSFGYTDDKMIFHDLTLCAGEGKTVAIVGPTGAGKTTLINLLMRFYDVNGGEITIDGKDIHDVTRSSLRRSYAMVLQDTWLFHGTIYDNIRYGNEKAAREEVIKAAKAANIHNYIMSLPKGYDTILTDEGTNISKGQKQMLTIARAMLLEANILILDEATSNVDTRTEIMIQDAMAKLMKNKTCFIIAHRLSTIRNADQILVVKDGDIIEQGNHVDLMEKRGFYRQLYDSQFD